MFTPAMPLRAIGCSLALLFAAGPLTAAEVDAKSQKVIDDFGKFYAALKGFRVQTNVALHVEQGGQKQDQDFAIKLAAERPNKLSFLLESAQGGAQIVSDGSEVSAYINAFQKYLVEKAPAAWDGLWKNPLVQGPMSFGNAATVTQAILSDDPAKKLLEKVSEVAYGGTEEVDGKKAHLLKASGDEMDWQLWIAEGDKPVVLKFLPDLGKALEKMAKASKQKSLGDLKVVNTVSFKDWELDPKFDAEAFVFKAPEGVAKADSLQDLLGGGGKAEEPGPHPLVGKPAPKVKLELLDGGELDLAKLKGKVVILDFWATWCGPCVRAMPIIDAVAEKFKDKGVQLYAVNLQEEADEIKKFLDEAEIKVDVALDKTGETAAAYKAEAIPQTVLIGKDGSVQVVHVGLLPNLEEQLTDNLTALVAGKDLAAETLAKAKEKADAAAAEADKEAEPKPKDPTETVKPKADAKPGKLKIEINKKK